MTEEEKKRTVPVTEMIVDVGARSKEEAVSDFRIRIGEPVVPDVDFEYDEERDLLIGKAFDCRLGCARLLGTLKELEGRKLDVDVTAAFAVQEEVGTRGAAVTANRIKPDVAIVFEGCPADDTFGEGHAVQTALKSGPMLRHIDARMITNPRFQRHALDIGRRLGVPVQEAVRSGGSTNGAPIHLSRLWVPVIVVGLPVRYIHTHYGIASYSDYKAAVALAVEVVQSLNEAVVRGV
jgi:putative aminopeptidase FrvX